MIIRQIKSGGFDSNFSYLLTAAGGESAIIDPCGDSDRIRTALAAVDNPEPKYILITHGHGDHISALTAVKSFFPAPVAAHPACGCRVDIKLRDRQQLPLGNNYIVCRYSPGHTPDSVIFRLDDDTAVFTGDTLFIRDCGFCTAATMFRTLREVIWPLADSHLVYPGHDYWEVPNAPLGEVRQINPYLAAGDLAEFKAQLKNLH